MLSSFGIRFADEKAAIDARAVRYSVQETYIGVKDAISSGKWNQFGEEESKEDHNNAPSIQQRSFLSALYEVVTSPFTWSAGTQETSGECNSAQMDEPTEDIISPAETTQNAAVTKETVHQRLNPVAEEVFEEKPPPATDDRSQKNDLLEEEEEEEEEERATASASSYKEEEKPTELSKEDADKCETEQEEASSSAKGESAEENVDFRMSKYQMEPIHATRVVNEATIGFAEETVDRALEMFRSAVGDLEEAAKQAKSAAAMLLEDGHAIVQDATALVAGKGHNTSILPCHLHGVIDDCQFEAPKRGRSREEEDAAYKETLAMLDSAAKQANFEADRTREIPQDSQEKEETQGSSQAAQQSNGSADEQLVNGIQSEVVQGSTAQELSVVVDPENTSRITRTSASSPRSDCEYETIYIEEGEEGYSEAESVEEVEVSDVSDFDDCDNV